MRRGRAPGQGPELEWGVLCALDMEAAPVVKLLAQRRKTIADRFWLVEGTLLGRGVAVVRCGTRRRDLLAAADALLTVHQVRWVVAAGFAIGLRENTRAGDVVIGNELWDGTGAPLTVDVRLAPNKTAASRETVHVGRLLSVARWPRLVGDKQGLCTQSKALAADLHSYPLARDCADKGVQFLAVRILVEDASCFTGPESLAVYHPSASFRAGGVMGALLRGSGQAGRIWKIRAAAQGYSRRLAEVLRDILPRLE